MEDIVIQNDCRPVKARLLITTTPLLERFDPFFVGEQIVDVVEAVYQTGFFVGIDVEVFALARSLVGDGLGRQVDFDFCFRQKSSRKAQPGKVR